MDTPWGRRVSHTVSGFTVILTLSSDPSSRKIMSRAYIYIIGGRDPKFSVWIHLGVVECHTLFIDQCVSFMKIYCLWGYFINL